MKEPTLILDETSAHELRILAFIFALLMTLYFGYSTVKFGLLSTKSLVKNTVEMRIIQHNVRCVCPKCGTKGLPSCPLCKVTTYWNGYIGAFICPVCGQSGFPTCPRCQSAMSWIETQ